LTGHSCGCGPDHDRRHRQGRRQPGCRRESITVSRQSAAIWPCPWGKVQPSVNRAGHLRGYRGQEADEMAGIRRAAALVIAGGALLILGVFRKTIL
jgi:hypothetical protein